MPIYRTCEQCNKSYAVSPSRAASTRFCSMACKIASSRTAERRDLTCEACGDTFTSAADHGVWPRFCSRSCFLSQCVQPREKPCANCGALFVADGSSHDSEDGRRKYCSKACQIESLRRGDEYQCLNCGAPFYLSAAALRQRGEPGCCSKKCQNEFYIGARHVGFKGGVYTHSQSGEKHLLLRRPGYVSKYVGEHRIIASREIGRLVTRGECVIRINRNPEDNRPENLFICESLSEFSRRRNGSLPWPTTSNLSEYKSGAMSKCNSDAHSDKEQS